MTDTDRAVDTAVDIEAPASDVWDALTRAEELVRWFPLRARVVPGVGGTMHWSWDLEWQMTSRIDVWDPPRLLRLVQEAERPRDGAGRLLTGDEATPQKLVIEISLESRQGATRVRLVHSGFGHGSSWDDEVEGVAMGWHAELRSLRHYLHHHRGHDRHGAIARAATALPSGVVWSRLLEPGAFALVPARPAEGARFELTVGDGTAVSGTVLAHRRGAVFLGSVDELDGGVVRLSTFRAAGRTHVEAWAASYRSQRDRVRAVVRQSEAVLGRLFAASDRTVASAGS